MPNVGPHLAQCSPVTTLKFLTFGKGALGAHSALTLQAEWPVLPVATWLSMQAMALASSPRAGPAPAATLRPVPGPEQAGGPPLPGPSWAAGLGPAPVPTLSCGSPGFLSLSLFCQMGGQYLPPLETKWLLKSIPALTSGGVGAAGRGICQAAPLGGSVGSVPFALPARCPCSRSWISRFSRWLCVCVCARAHRSLCLP